MAVKQEATKKPAVQPSKNPSTTQSVVHQSKTPTSIQRVDDAPAYLTKGQSRGTEAMDQSDITLPRLALCQSNTPQRKKSDANYIPGLEEGDFFNTITGTNYGKKVELIPILFTKQRIKFNPLDQGGGIDCRSFNAKTGGHYSPEDCDKCQYSQFRIVDGEQVKPECLLFHNRASWVLGHNDLVVSSLKSTGLAVSKQWNSLVKISNRDMFGRVYELVSAEATKGGNQFYTVKINPKGWTPEDIYIQMVEYFDGLRNKNIVMDTTGMGHDEETNFDTEQM